VDSVIHLLDNQGPKWKLYEIVCTFTSCDIHWRKLYRKAAKTNKHLRHFRP